MAVDMNVMTWLIRLYSNDPAGWRTVIDKHEDFRVAVKTKWNNLNSNWNWKWLAIDLQNNSETPQACLHLGLCESRGVVNLKNMFRLN